MEESYSSLRNPILFRSLNKKKKQKKNIIIIIIIGLG
jgi:hypothetical protein